MLEKVKLYDEEELRMKNEKNKKMKKFVIIGIFASIIIITLLMGTIYYLLRNPNKITIYVYDVSSDKKSITSSENSKLEKIIHQEPKLDGSKVIYFPIRETGALFGLNTGIGDTTTRTEDKDICNVEIKDEQGNIQEIAIFTLDSTTIYKITNPNKGSDRDYEYEEIKVENPIIKKDDELYVDIYGLKKAFNFSISYNEQAKKITIYTLPNLVKQAESKIEEKSKGNDTNFGRLDENFINKKALLDNMMVIVSKNGSSKGVRLLNSINTEKLQFVYKDINYIPQKGLFFVTYEDNKVGIKNPEGTDIILKKFDKLTLIDSENELYLTELGGLYGVCDRTGNTVIPTEYSKIGVDVGQYDANGLKNGYVLLGKIIPVQENNKWSFYKIENVKNTDGTNSIICNQIQNVECDSIGCITRSTGTTAKNLMVIPEYNLIVVQKQQYYGLMDFTGALPIPAVLKDAYIATISEKTDYYMVGEKDGKEHIGNIIEYLKKKEYKKIE